MELIINKGGKKGTLVLQGAQTIMQANALKESILDAFQKVEGLEIDLSGIDEIDLSFLQLICSAHRTSHELKKELFLKKHWPKAMKKTAAAAGFFLHRRCPYDLENHCLWQKEGDE